MEALSFFASAFTALFIIVEPFGALPGFSSLTRGKSNAEIKDIAKRACIAGALILLGFALVGRFLMGALGVSMDALRAAGGLLLLLTALDMLRAKRESSCRCSAEELQAASKQEDIAIVPVAIPMLAGPGAMATVMLLASRAASSVEWLSLFVVIALVFLLSYFILRCTVFFHRFLGDAVLSVVQRVLGLLLAAVSLQFIVRGVSGLWLSSLS
jgi:multiple antibiotic resistance protein